MRPLVSASRALPLSRCHSQSLCDENTTTKSFVTKKCIFFVVWIHLLGYTVHLFEWSSDNSLSSCSCAMMSNKTMLQKYSAKERLELDERTDGMVGCEDWQSLRNLLYTPNEENWARLCDLFASWTRGAGLDLALSYAREHLSHWPAILCRSVPSWKDALLGEEPLHPLWPFVKMLDLGGCHVTDAELNALIQYTDLSQLHYLDLSDNLLARDGPRYLSSVYAVDLPELRYLNLNSHHSAPANRIGTDGLQELLRHPMMTRLTHLYLYNNDIGDAGIRGLLGSPRIANLTHLNLGANAVGRLSASVLAHAPHLSKLTHLNLSQTFIGTQGAVTIANSPHLRALRSLDLHASRISAAGAEAIAQSAHLTKLEKLSLCLNPLSEKGAIALSQASHLVGLQELRLGSTQLSNHGLQALAQSPWLQGVRVLWLPNNDLDDRGLLSLIQSPFLRKVEVLGLAHNRLSADGVMALLSSSLGARLRSLDLMGNQLGDEGAMRLRAFEPLPKLRRLDLRMNGLSSSTRETLRQTPLLQHIDRCLLD